ncbi:MAG TPA: cytochrome c [Candidatus Baltobacteraceae bacterium]|nr:cytochrome c [Candidatus Baltobacteraceae bacterium]
MKYASLTALAFVAVLAACAKSGGGNAASSAAPAASAAVTAAAVNPGQSVYQANCSTCHQTNGGGVRGAFPPLAQNPTVIGDPIAVIHDVKFGLSGEIHVNGNGYNGMMPAWGQQLSDSDIAAVITYVRSAWGNKASAVTSAQVAAVSQ